jgi:hypothetical protein
LSLFFMASCNNVPARCDTTSRKGSKCRHGSFYASSRSRSQTVFLKPSKGHESSIWYAESFGGFTRCLERRRSSMDTSAFIRVWVHSFHCMLSETGRSFSWRKFEALDFVDVAFILVYSKRSECMQQIQHIVTRSWTAWG